MASLSALLVVLSFVEAKGAVYQAKILVYDQEHTDCQVCPLVSSPRPLIPGTGHARQHRRLQQNGQALGAIPGFSHGAC